MAAGTAKTVPKSPKAEPSAVTEGLLPHIITILPPRLVKFLSRLYKQESPGSGSEKQEVKPSQDVTYTGGTSKTGHKQDAAGRSEVKMR